MSKTDQPKPNPSITSNNSGTYNPGTISDESIYMLDPANNDIMLEEFPEGPYGAATTAAKPGKSTPWQKNQQSVSAFRDANPDFSDRKVAREEPPRNAPRGSVEGQA